jgi:hypothetical protein
MSFAFCGRAEDHTKDVDFTSSGIKKRWRAGYDHTVHAIKQAPWRQKIDPLEGVFLHEPNASFAMEEMATGILPSQCLRDGGAKSEEPSMRPV